jgi:hypothetical protein
VDVVKYYCLNCGNVDGVFGVGGHVEMYEGIYGKGMVCDFDYL